MEWNAQHSYQEIGTGNLADIGSNASEVCVSCCRSGAQVISQELEGRAPTGAFVVGSTPADLCSTSAGKPWWSLVYWHCNLCQAAWYSYILYAQAYDCRVDDPLYSPAAVEQRSRANSGQPALPTPTTHSQMQGLCTFQTESTANMANKSAGDSSSVNSGTNQGTLVNPYRNIVPRDNWTLYGTDGGVEDAWLSRTPNNVDGDNKEEEEDEEGGSCRHKRGPNFDPEGYRKTRCRGACEMHRRNKKACRHPEGDT